MKRRNKKQKEEGREGKGREKGKKSGEGKGMKKDGVYNQHSICCIGDN